MQRTNQDLQQLFLDYQRIEKALQFLEKSYPRHPKLEEIAAQIGLSEYHFHRLFTRWVGISPKRFLQFLTKEHARKVLSESSNLLEATYQSGLSSPGRLHDLFVTYEAMTPGECKNRGKGLDIHYGFHPTPFGESLLALTKRGICFLAFVDGNDREGVLQAFFQYWHQAAFHENPEHTGRLADKIFTVLQQPTSESIPLYLRGTNFQIKVWEALIRIPPARLVTYEDIALHLGMPEGARAVSRAIAGNPISLLIPCHRVIRKMGAFSGYRWGTARKKALIGWEFAQAAE